MTQQIHFTSENLKIPSTIDLYLQDYLSQTHRTQLCEPPIKMYTIIYRAGNLILK